jgi:TonB family protein
MKTPFRLLFLSLLAFAFAEGRSDSAPVVTKPGYTVVVDVTFDEKGEAVNGKIHQTDDFMGEQVLNQIAMKLAGKVKQQPRMKDGKPVQFTVRIPFNFPVEGDEGAAANEAPKPRIHSAVKPDYPADLAKANEPGGAIMELIIGADGNIKDARVMRASHPEFGQAALEAIHRWIFVPALKDGQPVESRWRMAMVFSINGLLPDWKWRVAPRPSLGEYVAIRPAPLAAAPAVPNASVAPATATTPAGTSPAPATSTTAVENPPAPGK